VYWGGAEAVERDDRVAHRRDVCDAIMEITAELVAETAIDRAIRHATIRHGSITQQRSQFVF